MNNCIQDYIEACTEHRAELIAEVRRNNPVLVDRHYDDVTGWMQVWKTRYRKETNCGQALCPVHSDERDTSMNLTLLMEAALLPDAEATLDPSLAIPESFGGRMPPLVLS